MPISLIRGEIPGCRSKNDLAPAALRAVAMTVRKLRYACIRLFISRHRVALSFINNNFKKLLKRKNNQTGVYL